jgi:hypothetical protein
MIEEEALAPFPSWGNVKSQYGAVGDGVVDDTLSIQRALNDLGRVGKPQVLYLPAGTYKITATLNLLGSNARGSDTFGVGGVGIIGADPATTTIKWAGPSGQAMLIQNGGLATRYNRITWDGSRTAGYGVAHWWNAKGGRLYGGSFEHLDEVFKDMNIGIMAGRLGANYGELDSEGQVRRVAFIRNTYAGLDVGSWNALDWWVWDSQFVDCARGVSNQYSLNDAGVTTGAGAMYVYRSLFEGSAVADMAISNTGWFSLHNNVSIGSRRFFESTPIGANSAVVIAENNRVVQSTSSVPISFGDTGPLLMVDNQIQATTSTYELTDSTAGRDVLSLGNQVTAGPPPASGSDRLLSIDDVNVTAASISTLPLVLPSTPAVTAHQVYEVPTGASAEQIQALIDQSAQSSDPQPIVHFGHDTWVLNKALQISPHRSVQLVGDGYGSLLIWSGAAVGPMLNIAAPAKVTIRDMQWTGSATAINISGADQAGGRIQIVGSMIGILAAKNLETTRLSLQANTTIAAISFNDVVHAVAISNGGIGPVSLAKNSNFLMADTWYEGTETALFRMPSATFTYLGGHMAPATHTGSANLADPTILLNHFIGTASWLGMQFNLSAVPSGTGIQVDGENPQTQAYFMGLTSDKADYFRRTSGNTGPGTVGFMLNRTAQRTPLNGYFGLSRRTWFDTQAADQDSSSSNDIRNAWSQARSLAWDSTVQQVPPGSVDIRLYHVKMVDTAGLVISGR